MSAPRRIDVSLESVRRLLRVGATPNLINLLQKQHPADLAQIFAELPEKEYLAQLKHIEKHIHSSPNRVKHSMNAALIAIGSRGGDLTKEALAAAKRIGKVEVDHGDTSCKTPDATPYIKKMLERKRKKKTAKQAEAKKSVTRKTSRKKTAAH